MPSYPTIQQAVNAVTAGSLIEVCPGPYPEQVVVNKNVTLKGIAAANQGAAIITSPAGGLVQNTASLATGNPIAAQLLVQAPATAVTITNITVDGNNSQIATCGLNPIGIYFQNASGTITRVAVLNSTPSPGFEGCQTGLGIFAQSGGGGGSVVTISSNHVEGYAKNGITGNEGGTNVTITGNSVIGVGPTTGAAQNSIQIGFGAAGNITKNTVGSDVWSPDNIGDPGDAAAGILVYASAGVNITSNNVSDTQFGIAVVSDPNFGNANNSLVTKNTVSATHIFDGIDLCSNGNTVNTNIVNGSDEAGIHVDDSCTGSATGNQVTKNTINSACAGILIGPGATGNTTAPNTYYNVVTQRLDNATQCSPPARPSKKGSRHATVRAARP
ncbi:MAG TPA: right-handed parallel beta-helix repeat-containing protein [Terriglobales bacterium]|nr:right-handed parallel beta-helix repeat-containing protein [Terriglobales bacterium]